MKKILLSLIILNILLITAFANSSSTFKVKIQNKEVSVKTAKVEVDGENYSKEFLPFTKDGRTFVAIREISEGLGAKCEWDGEKKSVLIKMDDKEIKMKIDSTVVYINDERKKVDKSSQPKLVLYKNPRQETKTMVPLRFISETFDYDVSWDKDTNMVKISTRKAEGIRDDSTDENTKNSKEAKKSESSKNNGSKKSVKKDYTTNSIVKNVFQSAEEVRETKSFESRISKEGKEEAYKAVGLNIDDFKEEERVIKKKIVADGKIKIVIDPGHGGKDQGATACDNETYEKDYVLEVATKLYDKMQNTPYEILITRSRDEFIKLQDRASLSNENNAHLFLSIHFNSAPNKDANGIEVLYASEKNVKIKTVEQKYFAKEILDALIEETGAVNRGIKNRPNLIVLNKTKNVSALAELGFISNEEELEKIKSDEYIDKLVEGLYKGINSYIDKYVEK